MVFVPTTRTKRCIKCEQRKPITEFARRKHPTRELYAARCKDCIREYQREWSKAQGGAWYGKAQRDRRRERNRDHVRAHLAEHPCVDCDEDDIVVLEFDHVRGEKIDNVSTLVVDGRPLQMLMDEIAKCDVVCANCHRRRTYGRAESCWRIKDLALGD